MRLFSVLLVLALAGPRAAVAAVAPGTQSTLPPDRPTALAPNTSYDPKIPTLKAVLGYDTGERITPPEDLTVYLKAAFGRSDMAAKSVTPRRWTQAKIWRA